MRLTRRQFGGLVGGGAFAAAGLAACTSPPSHPSTPTPTTLPSTVASAAIAALLEDIPTRTITPLSAERLAPGLTPPTNRWFSGLVFGEEPQPVFPSPLGFAVTEDGFEVWLPRVEVVDKAIIGQRGGGLTLSLGESAGPVSALVVAYDVASVTVRLHDSSGAALADVLLAQGSPVVTVQALADLTTVGPVPYAQAGDAWRARVEGTDYAVIGDVSVDDTRVSLSQGSTCTWFVAPPGVEVADLAGLVAPITSTSFSWQLGEDEATTTIRYEGSPTLVTARPHQIAEMVGEAAPLGSYAGVYGELTLLHTEELSWRSRRWEIRAGLDLSGMDDEQRARVAEQVSADVAGTPAYPQDSYFGSKALYRDAMLLDLALGVGADEAAATVTARLTEALELWAEPGGANERDTQCFVYDETNRGLVGLEPSFGSEEFNDHHFHYGYLLYAAGVACAHNPELAARLAPVFDLVAADIASPVDTGFFPQLRPFDVYASHSWASGTSPFADGNNQESSSEGVHAWAGLALWAKARGDEDLERQAAWMHAVEAQGALSYWLQPDLSAFQGFNHQVIGIGWGAKRDYATWFSPEPVAILMIQVIPASPSAGYLAADPERVSAAVEEAVGSDGFGKQYGDYVLLYSSLAGPEAAAQALDDIGQVEDIIDDGFSLAYLLAFLMTRQ